METARPQIWIRIRIVSTECTAIVQGWGALVAVGQERNAQKLMWFDNDRDNLPVFGHANVGIIDVGFNIMHPKQQHMVAQDRIETGRPYIDACLSGKGFHGESCS